MKVKSYSYVMRRKVYRGLEFITEAVTSADTEDAILYLLLYRIDNVIDPLRLSRFLHEGEKSRYTILGCVFNSVDDPRYHYIITIEKIPKRS